MEILIPYLHMRRNRSTVEHRGKSVQIFCFVLGHSGDESSGHNRRFVPRFSPTHGGGAGCNSGNNIISATVESCFTGCESNENPSIEDKK